MPIEILKFLTGIYFGSAFFSLIVMLPWWILLTIFTPKSVMEKFFKEPHFTLTETFMMREYPGSFLRTGIFGFALLWPSVGKKRKLSNMRDHVPKWFDWAARILAAVGLLLFLICATLTPLLYFVEPIP